jgi:hypothetical protein
MLFKLSHYPRIHWLDKERRPARVVIFSRVLMRVAAGTAALR